MGSFSLKEAPSRKFVLSHSTRIDSSYTGRYCGVRSGVPLPNALFDTRLTPIARLAGMSRLEDFVSLLKADRAASPHRAATEALTIGETSFFRDVKPFEVLRESVLPRLIERRRGERRLRLWSAASSTGQEAYSLAMLLLEHFPELAQWDVKIIGTDISRHVVEQARKARYRRMEVNCGLSAQMLMKYFVRDGEEWQVCERARAMCEFQQMNLCAMPPEFAEFDLVLLRNVLLYFSPPERRTLFSKVHRRMAMDGYLLLGDAEQAEESTDLFSLELVSDYYLYRPSIGA
jgi:chemotaxis protein methyltransferase CheR